MALTDLVEGFLNERGYKGPMPEIHIGEKSFAVDSSKGYGTEDSKNGKEIIFISQDSLNSPDVLQKLGHELGHLVKYDKDEKTAENIGSKIENIKPEEEKNYNEYLASIKDKYKDLPSLEESKELENRIPDEYKENWAIGLSFAGTTTLGASGGVGTTYYVAYDPENRKIEFFTTGDASINVGTPSVGASVGLIYFPNAVSSKDIEGKSSVIGGGYIFYGLDIYNPNFNSNEKTGIKTSIGISGPFPMEGHGGTINESTVIGGVDKVYLIDVENGVIKSIDKKLNLKGVNYWESK